MKTQIVYTLTSTEEDHYLEQLIMSVYTLKRYNPKAKVIVVTDKRTYKSLSGWRSILLEMVSEIEIISIPTGFNKMQSSRYLKTNLRKFVKGDYLFIDTDTIICSRLDSIDKTKGDIALVADCNGNLMLDEPAVIERCSSAGFSDMENQPYFNSGVMFVRDTPVAHHFYEEWYNLWLYSVSRSTYLDQPSMNYSNVKSGYLIQELPGEWNCQIFFKGWGVLPRAKILHYAGGGKNEKLNILYRNIREHKFSDDFMGYLLRRPKIRLYAYLTDVIDNKGVVLMLYLRVYLSLFTK